MVKNQALPSMHAASYSVHACSVHDAILFFGPKLDILPLSGPAA